MYCSACGQNVNPTLKYCNNCGMRVESEPARAPARTSMISIGSIFIACIGLMAFYPILRELLHSSIDTAAMIVIMVSYLLTVFGMFGVLIWQGRRQSDEVPYSGNRSSAGFGGRDAFRGINTAQLPEPASPPASVTEHTTRTLDKIPISKH